MKRRSRLTRQPHSRQFFPHFLVIIVLILSAGYAPAQEAPCLELRNKQVDFIDLKSPGDTSRCRNLRSPRTSISQDQGVDNFTISGVVRHEGGLPLPGVTMTLVITNRNVTLTVVTGDNGSYFFDGLQIVDEFTLTPSKEEYTFTPPSVSYVIVRDVVYNFSAQGPPPVPPVPPANEPTLAWTSYYHNLPPSGSSLTPNADYHAMVARDMGGNVFVAGTSHRENFQQNGNTDISLFKTDANGNRLWSRA